jgi:hypothetical protein
VLKGLEGRENRKKPDTTFDNLLFMCERARNAMRASMLDFEKKRT